MFVLSRNMKKNISVFFFFFFGLSENFQFLVVKFSVYLNRRVFVMISLSIKQSRSQESVHKLKGQFKNFRILKIRRMFVYPIHTRLFSLYITGERGYTLHMCKYM